MSAAGTVCFYSPVPVDLVVDLNGWFFAGPGFTPVVARPGVRHPSGQSPSALRTVPKVQVGGANVLEVKVTEIAGVPATGVGAVSLNVAVTNPAAAGFITVFPCGPRNLVASVNYIAGQTVANAVIAPVSPSGTVCFYSSRRADLVVDVNGWFAG